MRLTLVLAFVCSPVPTTGCTIVQGVEVDVRDNHESSGSPVSHFTFFVEGRDDTEGSE